MRPRTLSSFVLILASAAVYAAPQSYRITGTFDPAQSSGTLASLGGTSFQFDLTYDPDEVASDKSGPGYTSLEFSSVLGSVTTTIGTFGPGPGSASSYKDSGNSGFSIGAFAFDGDRSAKAFGLDFSSFVTSLPSDLASFSASNSGGFRLLDLPTFGEAGAAGIAASTNLTIQAVPEPTSLVALGLGALGLVRRRRR